MKWWKIALIVSVIWTVIVIGAGIIHTELILGETITEEQDEVISSAYGMAFAVGLVVTWVLASLFRKRESNSS